MIKRLISSFVFVLDTKQSESVEIIEGEAYVGGVEIGPRFEMFTSPYLVKEAERLNV